MIKSNQLFSKLETSASTSLEDTLPIDLTFYSNRGDKYGILGRDDITDMIVKQTKYITLEVNGIVNKITLLDFPNSNNYELVMNGLKYCTAKFNPTDQTHEFDLSKLPNFYTNITKRNDEPLINDRDHYINCNAFDEIKLCYDQSLNLESEHKVRFYGYFKGSNKDFIKQNSIKLDSGTCLKQDEVWVQGYFDVIVYPYNTFMILLNYPTDSLDIIADTNGGTIIFRADGIDYATFDSSTELTRLKFYDPNLVTVGSENEYLCNDININTVNFSKIDSIILITINCKITKLYQNYYKIFDYPSRAPVFG